MRRRPLLPVLACALAFLPACAFEQVAQVASSTSRDTPRSLDAPRGYRAVLAPATWALERVSRDGTAIWIRSAASDCYEFRHAEVSEVIGGLRIKVLDRVLIPEPGYGCLLPLYLEAGRHRIDLPRRLENDKIFGECVPGQETAEQRICAAMHEAADS